MAILGFLGKGNMGGALAKAASKNEHNKIYLYNRTNSKAAVLAKQTGGEVIDNLELVEKSDYIFLGVKPQMLENLAKDISESLKNRNTPFVIVSMIAGKTISDVKGALGGNFPVIRILPNIPVAIGEGIILYDCDETVTAAQKDIFLDAMKYAGLLSEIDEKLMDAACCISGCGPAFAAMFIEALSDGAVACGLPRDRAVEYSAQMLSGSAKYILDSKLHPGAFKDSVCSPGGTTIQGVRSLERGAFRSSVTEAVISAFDKTKSL